MSQDVKQADEITVREVGQVLLRYRLSIIVMTLFFTIGAFVYAYFQPNIYTAQVTIELTKERMGDSSDAMMQALGGTSTNLDNEQALIRSRFLAIKAVEYLELGTRYFRIGGFRESELYKNAPFIVSVDFLDEALYDKRFYLYPIDEKRFELRVGEKVWTTFGGLKAAIQSLVDSEADPISYRNVCNFDDVISTPWFKLKVQKIHTLEDASYSFSSMPNEQMYYMVQEGVRTSILSARGTMLALSYSDPDPLRAQEVANAVAQAFLDQEIDQKTITADRTLQFIDEQLAAINDALKKSELKLEDFKERNIVIDIAQKAGVTSEKLGEYESQLQQLEIEESILANIQQYILSGKEVVGISAGAANFTNAAIVNMINDLQEKETLRKTLLVEYTELHPDVVKLSEQINSIKQNIKFALENNLHTLQQRKRSLRQIIDGYRRSLQELPEQERKLAELTRSFMVNEKIYSFLLEKRAEMAILKSSTVSKTRIIDSALVPTQPVRPNRLMMVLAGVLLGLIAGTALAFLRESLDNTIKSGEDIERYTAIPLYAVIPSVADRKKLSSAFFEAFRVLRTNLRFLSAEKPNKIVVVTSSVSEEGKTTVASNLGRVIGKSEQKAVVLDLDMRSANLHTCFEVENRRGMSTLLTGQNTLEEVILQSGEKNLDIIPAGPKPPNPSELLLSERLDEVIQLLSSRYDYIILDTPPVGLVTDAMIVMKSADISLLVVKAGYTQKEFVRNLDKMVRQHQLEHLGIVLNDIELKNRSGYGYGYGYGYGSEKYYEDARS